MSEFNFNFEYPFQIGIEVPLQNQKMLLCDRIDTLSTGSYSVIKISQNPITAHYLYKGNLYKAYNYFSYTFLLYSEIASLQNRLKPLEINNSIYYKISEDSGITIKQLATTYNETNKEIVSKYKPDIRSGRDKIILKTVPFYWDADGSLATSQLDKKCAYAIVSADFNVLEHANVAYMWGGAYTGDGLNAYDHQIKSNVTDKNTFLVEFLNFRYSFWYKYRSSNGSDTIRTFVQGRSIDNDDYFGVGHNNIRNKTWNVSPPNDTDWHFFERKFSLSEPMEWWDNAKVSGYVTTGNSGNTVEDMINAPFLTPPATVIGDRIYLNISGVKYYGTIYFVSSSDVSVTWDDGITPPNSSGDTYAVYGKEHGINSEYLVNRAVVGIYNENNCGTEDCDMRTAYAYPVLEFAPFIDTLNGYFDMEEKPVGFDYKELDNKNIIENLNGTSKIFDYTDGYKRYEFTASFEDYPTYLLEYLLELQSWNKEGWNIVIRPFCKRLPPVLIGDLIISNINYNNPDPDLVNFKIKFIEN